MARALRRGRSLLKINFRENLKKALENLKTCDILSISKVKNNTKPTEKIMLPETTMLLKRTFPSHFLPEIDTRYQRELRDKMSKDVLRITRAAINIEKNWETGDFGKDYAEIYCACVGLQKKIDKLEEDVAGEKTQTLVRAMWSVINRLLGVNEYLRADNTSYKLVRSIAYLSVHLLYGFKKSDYKLLLENVSKLEQIPA